jgi:hypothetical protein
LAEALAALAAAAFLSASERSCGDKGRKLTVIPLGSANGSAAGGVGAATDLS